MSVPGLQRTGTGTPLVLLHGFTCTWRVWQPLLPALSQHHDVLAATLPGHRGGPPMPPDTPVSIATLADGVERILDAEGVETAHFAGNSLGGWLSLELARRGRARSVVGIAPAGGWSADDDIGSVARSIRSSLRLAKLAAPIAGPALRVPEVRRLALKVVMERGDRMPADEVAEMMQDAIGCEIAEEFAEASHRDGPFTGDMSHVTVPIRIAWCQNDRLLHADRHGRPLLDRIPHVEFTVLPNVGHTPMYDDPLLCVATILDVTRAVDGAADEAADPTGQGAGR